MDTPTIIKTEMATSGSSALQPWEKTDVGDNGMTGTGLAFLDMIKGTGHIRY